MPAARDFFCLAPLTANLNSLVASVLLFAWVSALTGRRRQKLMARQLWHLALADLIDAVLNTPWFALDCLNNFAGVGDEWSRSLDVWCQIGIANNVLFITSVLVETHIALACFFGMWRLTGAQQVLSKLLPLAWPGGLLLGGAIAVLSDVSWDSAAGTCNTGSDEGHLMKVIISTIALAICSAAYVATCVFAHRQAGHLAAARISQQTKVFLLAAIVTWCPLIAYVYASVATRGHLVPYRENVWGEATYYLVYTFFFSNGFLNACAYARSSRLMQQELSARIANKPELRPAADGDYELRSLVVAFREYPDVHVINGWTTREANFNAALETAELATAKADRRLSRTESCSSDTPSAVLSPTAADENGCVELVQIQSPDDAGGAPAQDTASMLHALHADSGSGKKSVQERRRGISLEAPVLIDGEDMGCSFSVDFLECFDYDGGHAPEPPSAASRAADP